MRTKINELSHENCTSLERFLQRRCEIIITCVAYVVTKRLTSRNPSPYLKNCLTYLQTTLPKVRRDLQRNGGYVMEYTNRDVGCLPQWEILIAEIGSRTNAVRLVIPTQFVQISLHYFRIETCNEHCIWTF